MKKEIKNNHMINNIILPTTYTFEDFAEAIEGIQKEHALEGQLAAVSREYWEGSRDEFCLTLPTMLEANLLTTLEALFDDQDSGWIGYWIYDLDFGAKYSEGTVKDKDGNNIPLETVEDLWNLLVDNYYEKHAGEEICKDSQCTENLI